jgi:hypothetical protein
MTIKKPFCNHIFEKTNDEYVEQCKFCKMCKARATNPCGCDNNQLECPKMSKKRLDKKVSAII